jgi:predicted ABC-type transport system involved in lysophospholipase L1 biosynthesis ATPase subunit
MSLRVRSLRFRYAGSRVDSLGGVDLDVAPGEICRILEPHGSGKSNLWPWRSKPAGLGERAGAPGAPNLAVGAALIALAGLALLWR